MRTRAIVVLCLICGAAAPRAEAQEKNSFAVGVNYTTRLANDEDAHGTGGIGISWRLGHSESGWGWAYGLGWFDTNLAHTVGGQHLEIGELKVRPVVAGYGYTHQLNPRWFVTADLVGGIAFNTFRGGDDVDGSSLAQSFGSHFSVAPIVRPELKTWYDINNRFGISMGGWYAFVRPKIALDTPFGRETFRVRADTFSLSTGIVYRIF